MSLVKLPKIGGNVQNYNLKNLNDLIESRSEQADIVNAINSGYLVFPGADFIYDRLKQQKDFEEKNDQILEVIEREKTTIGKTFDDDHNQLTSAFYFPFVNYLNCSNIPIIEIGDIGMCRNLRILDLSNNHLKHFDALCDLVNLFRLDLQNNQIVDLPDQAFWENLDNLKVLFLHNNPIGKLDYLKNLSACPSIEILTIYDTPMSLRKNYRHHVVNAIVTLKALDDFVVSDEEIIEEAVYDNLFKAHSSAMRIDYSFENDQTKTYDSALDETYRLISMVNTIISHYSPVHILQKYTRGFIARNEFKHMLQVKKIAEFNAQINNEIEVNSQTTIETGEAASKRIERWWKKPHPQPKVTPRLTDSSKTSHYNQKIFDDSRDDFVPKSGDSRKRNIIIDLGKLNKLNYNSLSNKPSHQEMSYQNSQNLQSYIDNSDTNNNSSVSFSNLVKLITAYQNETQNQNKTDPTYSYQMEKLIAKFNKQFKLEDTQNETTFRLPMLVPDNTILKVKEKYVIDMMKEKHDGTQAVKDMELECHKKINAIREDIPLIANEKPVTNDQRFFQKAFGNMSFGCLRAIDKAYTDRNKVDAKHQRKQKVEKLKEQKKYSMQRVEYYKEDKIKETKFSIKKDNEMKCTYDLKSEKEYDSLKDSVNDQRLKRNQLNKNRRKDVTLAVEFSKQHLSVSKALQKHEYLTHKELRSKENNDFILKLKNNKESQRELVRKYMQQRNVLRLIQSNNDRAIIEKRLHEDNEEELRNAKIRVEYLRYLEYNRRARVILKKPKDENPTNVTNVGETLYSNLEENGADSTVLTESPIMRIY